MKHYIMALSATLLLVAGCQNGDEPIPATPNDGVMRFEMSHPATRVTETAFEAGDKIGIYVTQYNGETPAELQISGNWANNVEATLTDGTWVTARNIFWCDGKADVYGYYPYMKPTSIDEHPFSVALDQSTEGDGETLGGYEASDFLWAKATGVEQSTGTVALQYRHCLSKFIIQLVKGPSYEGDFPENATMYIHNTVPTATIDFTTGAVTKYLFGEPETIKARQVGEGTYEAIIVPQRLDSRRPFVEMIVNGVSYLIEDTFNFKPGKAHTLSLVINSNPDQVQIEIGGSVVGGWD